MSMTLATDNRDRVARDPSADISEAEWTLRVQLAAAYRLIDHFGWTEQIYGHLTARVPGDDDGTAAHRPPARITTRSNRAGRTSRLCS